MKPPVRIVVALLGLVASALLAGLLHQRALLGAEQADALAALRWLGLSTLLGLALGGAVSPYLGLWLKGVDPVVPFMLTGATLLLVTLQIQSKTG